MSTENKKNPKSTEGSHKHTAPTESKFHSDEIKMESFATEKVKMNAMNGGDSNRSPFKSIKIGNQNTSHLSLMNLNPHYAMSFLDSWMIFKIKPENMN